MGIRVFSCVAAGLLGGVMVLGQSLTDHAAAIAGASAGVAGGRVVSDALSRVLESASDTTGTAAAETKKADTKKADNRPARGTSAPARGTTATSGSVSALSGPSAPVFAAPSAGFATSSPTPSAPVRPWRGPSADRAVASSGLPALVHFDMPPAPPAVVSAQLRAIAVGTSRGDVVGKVGIPAARITMDDDGHLVEILEYTANGNRVGSVRCSDGHVESVDAAAQ
jgi:hypothetical protein